MTEHVFLVVGPAGAGKTTAMSTLFEGETAMAWAEAAGAVDFGQVELTPGELVRLYGVPDRARYDFMWQILARRARGVLVLVSGAAQASVAQGLELVAQFAEFVAGGGLVVGVTHVDRSESPVPEALQRALAAAHPDAVVPVLTVDPRSRHHLVTALSVLAASLESRGRLDD